jgi:poly(A) polymerase
MARAGDDGQIPSLTSAKWLIDPATQAVFAALIATGAEARVVGGAVRNALMGTPVKDIDIATTALPDDVMRLAKRAGLHAVPTGIEHGTITVVAHHVPFEVTTLRRDIETFGRHARVTFTTDWREDALRRDFTMNALYCAADGTISDPIGGYDDLVARRVRFIGDPHARIREDFLRILRFFRFSAQYGNGVPDAEGLAAAIAEKSGLVDLSAERVRTELLLLLAAPAAVKAVQVMDEAQLLEPWIGKPANVARLARLVDIEVALEREGDPMMRLAALAHDKDLEAPADIQNRLRLSAAEAAQLARAGVRDPALNPNSGEHVAKTFLYRHGADTFTDGALMDWARSSDLPNDAKRTRRVRLPQRWAVPELPVRGSDLLELGVPASQQVGRIIAAFEDWWIAQDFPSDPARVSAKLRELAGV